MYKCLECCHGAKYWNALSSTAGVCADRHGQKGYHSHVSGGTLNKTTNIPGVPIACLLLFSVQGNGKLVAAGVHFWN